MTKPLAIVLIEPNPPDARWFELILEECGFPSHLTHFSSGRLAVQGLPEMAPPGLIVIESRLPILSLAEAMEQIRNIPDFCDVPIAVTVDDFHQQAEALRCGAIRCLIEPLDVEQVRSLIEKIGA